MEKRLENGRRGLVSGKANMEFAIGVLQIPVSNPWTGKGKDATGIGVFLNLKATTQFVQSYPIKAYHHLNCE